MLLADENLSLSIILELRQANFSVFSIFDESRGVSDEEVIRLATQKSASIVTEDKDFGELVFAHQIKDCSVILLRYNSEEEKEQVTKRLLHFLFGNYPFRQTIFATISSKKTRITII
ncbi:DUF5615 family PIN-like protein [uncultured Imperialibacter sp.]|uniref:DUF5615 family PIN-like protein n=1 Tax=uncultured Imperialibacter sp. TaxID=1672639 RepID=UPI0030D70F46|tara:strand:+ start:292 stop:642 length:351 start_codon:yes stop_codon:yes gene_type:complete